MHAVCVCVCVCWLIKISCTRATLSSLFSHFAFLSVLLLPLLFLAHAIKKLCLGVGICVVCLCLCVCVGVYVCVSLGSQSVSHCCCASLAQPPTSPLPPVLSALPAGKRKHNQKDNAIMPQWYNTYKNISRLCLPPTSSHSPSSSHLLLVYVCISLMHTYIFLSSLPLLLCGPLQCCLFSLSLLLFLLCLSSFWL